MGISVQCNECGSSRSVSESMAGRTIRCKVCRGTISVPGMVDDSPVALPVSTRRAKTPSRSRNSGAASWSFGLLEVLYGLSALLIALAFTFDTQFGGSTAAFLAGLVLCTVGFYGAMIVARAETFSERILYVLLPVYHFFYWAKYWTDTRRYVACCGIGFGLTCLSMVGLVVFLEQAPHRAAARGAHGPLVANNDPEWNRIRSEMDARMKADRDRFWEEQRRQTQSIAQSAGRPQVGPPINPLPEMKAPEMDMRSFNREQQQRLRELQERANTGRPNFVPSQSVPAQPAQAQNSVGPEQKLRNELAQPVLLPQLLSVSRQVRGKFEPEVGMQLFVKWKHNAWYRAEVTEVIGEPQRVGGQKVKVQFLAGWLTTDEEFGRDRVRIPNTPWPAISE